MPLGSTLDLRFEFSDPVKTVRARGRVVFENFGGRRGRPGIGLKFVRLDDIDRAFIGDFVRRWQDDTKNKKR